MRSIVRFSLYTTFSLILTSSVSLAEDTLTTQPQASNITVEAGKKLFENYCKHCHKTTSERSITGASGLLNILDRHDEAWINKWIKNPGDFAKTDVAARTLVDSNPFGLIMPILPVMQNEKNRLAIIEYLKTLK